MSMASGSRKRGRGIVEEPSTLVYTLIDPTLPFDHFSLIVRSLHSYMVEDIVQNRELQTIHVKLGYLASVENARRKLGGLCDKIIVHKLSSFVKEDELSLLEKLQKEYNFGAPTPDASEDLPPAIRKALTKKGRYKFVPQPVSDIED